MVHAILHIAGLPERQHAGHIDQDEDHLGRSDSEVAFPESSLASTVYKLRFVGGQLVVAEQRHTVVHLALDIPLVAEEDIGLAGRDTDPAGPMVQNYVSLYCTTSISSPSMKRQT